MKVCRMRVTRGPFHSFILIAWLADGDSLMCYIVTMGRQIAKMFSTFSLWGCLFIMVQRKLMHMVCSATFFPSLLCKWFCIYNSETHPIPYMVIVYKPVQLVVTECSKHQHVFFAWACGLSDTCQTEPLSVLLKSGWRSGHMIIFLWIVDDGLSEGIKWVAFQALWNLRNSFIQL